MYYHTQKGSNVPLKIILKMALDSFRFHEMPSSRQSQKIMDFFQPLPASDCAVKRARNARRMPAPR